MKAAFILALAMTATVATAAPTNIKIQSQKISVEKLDIFAAKELHWLSKSLGNEKITLLIDYGYLENNGKGVQYVKLEIPQKKIAYLYNGPSGVIASTDVITQVKKGIINLTEQIDQK